MFYDINIWDMAVSLDGYFCFIVISFNRLLSSWCRSSWKQRHILGLSVKTEDRLTPAGHNLVTQDISCKRATAHMNVRETVMIWLRDPVYVQCDDSLTSVNSDLDRSLSDRHRQCSTASWIDGKRWLFEMNSEKNPPRSNCCTTHTTATQWYCEISCICWRLIILCTLVIKWSWFSMWMFVWIKSGCLVLPTLTSSDVNSDINLCKILKNLEACLKKKVL